MIKALFVQEVDFGDYSRDVVEEVTADTMVELIDLAVTYARADEGKPSLYLISEDLTEQLQVAFAKRVAREKEEKAAKETKRKRDIARAKIESLETLINKIASGEEEQRLRAELAAVRNTETGK